MRKRISFRHALLALALASAATTCGDSTEPNSIVGSYAATTFLVTPTGQPTMDVLALGGSLSMVIASDLSTTGTLSLPPSVTGSIAFVASMAGTAVQSGDTVRFHQSSNSFVGDVDWIHSGKTLQSNRTIDGFNVLVTLTR